MSGKADGEVPVTFADGVRDDLASLVASTDDEAGTSELAALKRRIAELLVECKANPYLGEMMGSGWHPELAGCRRVRFAIPHAPRQAALPAHLPQRAVRRSTRRVPLARGGASCPAAGAPAGESAVTTSTVNYSR